MPQKHTIKTYVNDGVYHIYNRGVEKKKIFLNDFDHHVFLAHLKEALIPKEKLQQKKQDITFKGVSFKGVRKLPKNYNGKIDLLAYCLMPNHFHFLLKQSDNRIIDSFMRSILTRYSMYFNKKYKHSGPVFQGTYKAVLVSDDPYFLHLSRYIHRNPMKYTDNIINAYSSYGEYLGIRKTEWVKPDMILASFQPSKLPFLQHTNTYRSFVEFDRNTSLDEFLDSSLTLDNDEPEEENTL